MASVRSLAADPGQWPQFRGPQAMGISHAKGLPTTWSDDQNILWKTPLPGPGASSPIVWADRIFLTCHTGYAESSQHKGDMNELKRHLLCLDGADGKILWNTAVPAELPESERIRENHGYASSTPVADADRIYAFFGKTGVFAFDHQGGRLWRTQVGSELSGWGSAASPVLYKNLVIVNASVESQSVVALDKTTGTEQWRATGIKESWHAPFLVESGQGRIELIVAILGQVLSFDPDSGRPLWRCDTGIGWYMCPGPVAHEGVVYSIGGRTGGALAIRTGGQGDVTDSHRLWRLNKGSNVSSPVYHEGHLYFAHENLGIVYCVNAQTGHVLYEERLDSSLGQIYASALLAEGRIYFVGRNGRAAVLEAKPTYQPPIYNELRSDRGVFNASPAVIGNRLLLRSDKFLYCLGG